MALSTNEIVNKLWNLCNVLRDDGITYHQYLNELTFILFLKMAKETGKEADLPEGYRWEDLRTKEGIELLDFYKIMLVKLGSEGAGKTKEIYNNAQTNIQQPVNLRKIITHIDELDWYDAREEGLGEMYEGLLEKNASEKKSGAGQYFTPRPLINVMVRLMDPKPNERLNDPACGTYGFMIAAYHYLKAQTNDFYDLSEKENERLHNEGFHGAELVSDTHRLALMNAFLHGMAGNIFLGDSLSATAEQFKNYDLVLANPPFGAKKGGERPTRTDLLFKSSNKQLNFLQVIYRSLHTRGGARAAVVLPDNVLFEDGDGQRVRQDIMEKCDLHTILRLPTGIFYAQGVKTNVLFFSRGTKDKQNTQRVWFYDMRSDMPNFGKRTAFTESYFADFEKAYTAEDRTKISDPRWRVYSRADITAKNDSLDLGLLTESSNGKEEELGEPIELVREAADELKAIQGELDKMMELLG